MSSDENVKFVKGVMDEFHHTKDPASIFGAITDDAVIKAIIPDGTPISGEFQGREGFVRYFEKLGEVMEILGIRDVDYAGSADKVVVLCLEKARVKRTGVVFECETATVFTLKQGKIARIAALADMSAIVDAYRAESAR